MTFITNEKAFDDLSAYQDIKTTDKKNVGDIQIGATKQAKEKNEKVLLVAHQHIMEYHETKAAWQEVVSRYRLRGSGVTLEGRPDRSANSG